MSPELYTYKWLYTSMSVTLYTHIYTYISELYLHIWGTKYCIYISREIYTYE